MRRLRCVLPTLVCGLLAGCGGEARSGPPFAPVVDVAELMRNVVDPAADVVWGSVGTIIDGAGTNEIYPRSDEEWRLVLNAATTLTESGNLLMIGDRAVDAGLWMEMSQELVRVGRLALDAARAQDKEQIFDIGGDIYAACDSCHSIYWVGGPDRGLPSERGPSAP